MTWAQMQRHQHICIHISHTHTHAHAHKPPLLPQGSSFLNWLCAPVLTSPPFTKSWIISYLDVVLLQIYFIFRNTFRTNYIQFIIKRNMLPWVIWPEIEFLSLDVADVCGANCNGNETFYPNRLWWETNWLEVLHLSFREKKIGYLSWTRVE